MDSLCHVAQFSYTLVTIAESNINACATYGTTRSSYQPEGRRLHRALGACCMGNRSPLYLSQSWPHRICPHLASQRKYGANGVGWPPVGSGLRVIGVSCSCFGVDDNSSSHAACREQPAACGKRRLIGHAYSGRYGNDPNRSLARLRYDADHFPGVASEYSGGGNYHDCRCHSVWRA